MASRTRLIEEPSLSQEPTPNQPTTPVPTPVPASVPELIEALDALGLVDAETRSRPPARPSTVLRRALRRLPAASARPFVDAGALDATDPGGVARWASVLVAVHELPQVGLAAGQTEALLARAVHAVGDEFAGFVFLVAALDAMFDVACTDAEARHEASPELEFDEADSRMIEAWIAAVEAGVATPTYRLLQATLLLADGLAVAGELDAACDVLTVADGWCDSLADPVVGLTDADEIATACHERDAVVLAVHELGLTLLVAAGRLVEALELADARDLVARATEAPGSEPEVLVSVHAALVQAYGHLGRHEEALASAEWLLADSEARFGPTALQTVLSAVMVGTTMINLGRREEGLALALRVYGAVVEAGDARARAHAANQCAVALAASGRFGEAADSLDEALALASEAPELLTPATTVLHNFLAERRLE